MRSWRIRAALLSRKDSALEALLADVLADLHMEMELDDTRGNRLDVVLAVVGNQELGRAMAHARQVAQGAPILAILPLGSDPEALERAMSQGAATCYSFGQPLAELRQALLTVLSEPDSQPRRQRLFSAAQRALKLETA